MKKVAFVLYVVSVLLISGLARAATLADITPPKYQVPARIDTLSAEGSTLIVAVEAAPCQHEASVTMNQDTQDPVVLNVHVSTPVLMKVCSSQVVELRTAIDVPTLAKASHIQIDPKTVYQIKVDGYEFSMPVVGAELLE